MNMIFNKEENNKEDVKKDVLYYRKTYYYIIEEVIKITGDQKNELHSTFKKEILVKNFTKATTKDLVEEEWIKYLELVKEYLYENLDLIF